MKFLSRLRDLIPPAPQLTAPPVRLSSGSGRVLSCISRSHPAVTVQSTSKPRGYEGKIAGSLTWLAPQSCALERGQHLRIDLRGTGARAPELADVSSSVKDLLDVAVKKRMITPAQQSACRASLEETVRQLTAQRSGADQARTREKAFQAQIDLYLPRVTDPTRRTLSHPVRARIEHQAALNGHAHGPKQSFELEVTHLPRAVPDHVARRHERVAILEGRSTVSNAALEAHVKQHGLRSLSQGFRRYLEDLGRGTRATGASLVSQPFHGFHVEMDRPLSDMPRLASLAHALPLQAPSTPFEVLNEAHHILEAYAADLQAPNPAPAARRAVPQAPQAAVLPGSAAGRPDTKQVPEQMHGASTSRPIAKRRAPLAPHLLAQQESPPRPSHAAGHGLPERASRQPVRDEYRLMRPIDLDEWEGHTRQPQRPAGAPVDVSRTRGALSDEQRRITSAGADDAHRVGDRDLKRARLCAVTENAEPSHRVLLDAVMSKDGTSWLVPVGHKHEGGRLEQRVQRFDVQRLLDDANRLANQRDLRFEPSNV